MNDSTPIYELANRGGVDFESVLELSIATQEAGVSDLQSLRSSASELKQKLLLSSGASKLFDEIVAGKYSATETRASLKKETSPEVNNQEQTKTIEDKLQAKNSPTTSTAQSQPPEQEPKKSELSVTEKKLALGWKKMNLAKLPAVAVLGHIENMGKKMQIHAYIVRNNVKTLQDLENTPYHNFTSFRLERDRCVSTFAVASMREAIADNFWVDPKKENMLRNQADAIPNNSYPVSDLIAHIAEESEGVAAYVRSYVGERKIRTVDGLSSLSDSVLRGGGFKEKSLSLVRDIIAERYPSLINRESQSVPDERSEKKEDTSPKVVRGYSCEVDGCRLTVNGQRIIAQPNYRIGVLTVTEMTKKLERMFSLHSQGKDPEEIKRDPSIGFSVETINDYLAKARVIPEQKIPVQVLKEPLRNYQFRRDGCRLTVNGQEIKLVRGKGGNKDTLAKNLERIFHMHSIEGKNPDEIYRDPGVNLVLPTIMKYLRIAKVIPQAVTDKEKLLPSEVYLESRVVYDADLNATVHPAPPRNPLEFQPTLENLLK